MESLTARLRNCFGKGKDWATSPRGHRAGWISVIVVLVLGVGSWLGVPPLVRSLATHQASEWMERPVSIGRVSFNLYTLKLDVQQLHIGEHDSDRPFVDIGQLTVNLSWSSLFRLAAVVDSITVIKPEFHIVRTAEQRFNFTDLIEKANKEPSSDSKTHFALHNIKISDGDIAFDDQVTHTQHHVEKIQLGIPFIANLPSATKIDVQPLLQMVVDGSPFNISGKTRPFADTHESVIDFKLDQLDLTRYLAYVPVPLPVKIPQGFLSTNLQVHFIATQPQVMISLSGDASLDKLKVLDRKDAPLAELKHASVNLADVQPLRSVAHLNNISIDGLTTYATLNRDGSTNFQALGAPASPAKPLEKTAKPEQKSEPFDLSIASASLENGSVQFTDRRGTAPATLPIDGIRLKLLKLNTLGKTPATATLDLRVADGNLSAQSQVVASARQATAQLTLKQINLAALQPFLQQQLNGTLKSGTLDAQAQLKADLGRGTAKLQVQPATATIQNFELRAAKSKEAPLRWQNLKVVLDLLDLETRKATLSEVSADGLNLLARREADGSINLGKLARTSTAAKPATGQTASTQEKSWQFSISKIALDRAAVRFLDDAAPSPVKIEITPLKLSLLNLSSDLSQAAKLDLSGDLPRKGHFRITGDVAPSPLKADLLLDTQKLDLAAFGAYVGKLNATIASAALSTHARIKVSRNQQDQLRLSYRGNATLGRVRVLDKITDDAFINWNALTVNGIHAFLDGDKPLKLRIDSVALSDFFARLIMSSTGKLNLQDIMVADAQAPTSITQEAPTRPAPAPSPAAAPAAEAAPASPPANISLGEITLQGGQVRYTDNFIKPNYTATISSIAGKVGAFGTQNDKPADVLLQAQFDHNAPLTISGSINPLAPMAMVDITAKASSVELTDMTSYSTKYAGYPLTKGKLSFDVHYLLDQGKLTADNHIYVDQLTFGDHIDGPDATKLPVRLAVSLLKDANGVIDLHVPVSGSVSDPEFSLGGVILRAFVNLIAKAALSPFSLLSSAFGGGDELGYIEFNPGLAVLTPDAITHLETMTKVLTDRPALKLDISGRVDPELDKPGLREAMVAQRIKRQMIRDVVGKGDSVDTSTLQVPPESYDKYLKKAYDAESFTKPRNFIGLAKSLPPADMKKLMLTNMQVTDTDLQRLADQRSEAVRKWLADKVDPSRIFVVASKLDSKGIDDKGKTTRVDFSLK